MKKTIGILTLASSLFGADSEVSLDQAIVGANDSGGSSSFDITSNITRSGLIFPMRPLNTDDAFGTVSARTLTINGLNNTYDGGGSFRGFLVRSETVEINNLHFANFYTEGGVGGSGSVGGGGGGGLGSALFVYDGSTVTLTNCSFTSCTSKGGDGGNDNLPGNAGGGGGMNGRLETQGGSAIATAPAAAGGGGGFGGGGGDGDTTTVGGGGGGPATPGNNGSVGGGGGFDWTPASVGGDGGKAAAAPTDGAFGSGGGGTGLFPADGGIGNFAGGGGGCSTPGAFTGGSGGFGGGGGGISSTDTDQIGGTGGFGGGGGGSGNGTGGMSLFAGGQGASSETQGAGGGGGAGLGGAIFLMEGATLNIEGTFALQGNRVRRGVGGGTSSQGANGQALGADIFMNSGSTLNFQSDQTIIIPNPIKGDDINAGGGLNQMGTGLVVLNGVNTYVPDTTVSSGELRIQGSITSETFVTGGTLSGNFASTSLLTLSDGIFSPTDNVTLVQEYKQTGGTLSVDITSTLQNDTISASLLDVSGGDLLVVSAPGNYFAGTEYIISNSPDVGGSAFDSFSATAPNENNIDVTFGSLIVTLLEDRIFTHQNLNPGPPTIVANCILEDKTFDTNEEFKQVVIALGLLNDKEVNQALTTLSPTAFAALEWLSSRTQSQTAAVISQHLGELCCSPRESCECCDAFWISFYGLYQDNIRDYGFLRPFNGYTVGAIAGLDRLFFNHLYLGLAAGWNGTFFCWNPDRGNGNLSSFFGAAYARLETRWLDIDASFHGGTTQNDLHREIAFSFISSTARSCFWSQFMTGHLRIATNLTAGCATLTPFVLADYNHYRRPGFSEKGAGPINLSVHSAKQNIVRSEIGGILSWESDFCGDCLSPYVGYSRVRDDPKKTSHQNARFRSGECVMKIDAYKSAEWYDSPVIGLKNTRCDGLTFQAEYRGLFNHKTRIHAVEARLDVVF